MAEPAEPKTCMRKELRELVVLAVPSTAAFFLTKSQSFVSVLFVGHLGERQLAAASLATTLANVTGNSIMIGLSSGLATLCGQAYGAGSLQALGEWLQRALVMLILVVVPVSGLWLWIEPLLRLIGQEPDIAAMAGRYMALLVPGLWFYGISMALQFFLQAQRLVRPPMYTAMMSACLHPLFNYLLIFPCGMGYRGAAAAYSLSQGLQLAVMLLILRVSDLVTSTWRGWYWRTALSQWWPFLKLALPSLVLISEWWASEITIMLSGLLPDPHLQLSVMSIYQNTNALVFMLPVGIASAAATRVANELGAARPAAASAAARAALLLTASVVLLAGLGILAARHTWALLFVRGEPELIALTARTLLVLSAYVVFDGLQSVLGGVIKGAGRQASGAPVVVGSYYLAGLPTAAVLGFQLQLGVVGLCLGMLIGTALHCLCYLLVVLRIRWSEEARRAAARIAAKPAASGQLPVAVAVSTDRSMEGSTGQVVLQPLVLEMRESTTSSGMLQATAPSCPEELPLAPFTVPSHSLADDSVTDGGDSDGEAGDVEDESTALLL